jgi:IS1 family transposase
MEAARASDAVEAQLVEAVLESELLHADETSHPEHGHALWLWVFVSATTVLFYIGYRTQEIVVNLLGEAYAGWLMSDGYCVYRDYVRRLRCWAHLLRKAKGLEESFDAQARGFGRETRALLKRLMDAVYAARAGPPGEALEVRFASELAALATRCEQAKGSAHEKTRALAVELLRDWDAIFVVLAYPQLPLTNNEAERMLRHWVIWRRITHGTRTAVGSRAFALLASVIETCRRRGHAPWSYLGAVITAARQGQDVPVLPHP